MKYVSMSYVIYHCYYSYHCHLHIVSLFLGLTPIVMIHKFIRDIYALKYAGTSSSLILPHYHYRCHHYNVCMYVCHRIGAIGTESIRLCKGCQGYWQRNSKLFPPSTICMLRHATPLTPLHNTNQQMNLSINP